VTENVREIEELVVAHLPLVGYEVSAMLTRVPPSVTREELASAGGLALVLAARAYDPSTGVPFARYASLRIKGALIDELRSMDWASRGARQRMREVSSASERIGAVLGRVPTSAEVADAMGADVETVHKAQADLSRRVLSLEVDARAVVESVPDRSPQPEAALLGAERLQWLRAAVVTLPDRLRTVIEGTFLDDLPVAELAARMGVTASRVSQLKTEALGLLRDALNTGLDADLVPAAERPGGVAERRRQAYYSAVASRAALAPIAPLDAPAGVVPQQRGAGPAADHPSAGSARTSAAAC
jgi:RNA polymerase sigma factor for flagellar operon FliA